VTGLVLSSVAITALVVLGGFAAWQQRRANIARPAVRPRDPHQLARLLDRLLTSPLDLL